MRYVVAASAARFVRSIRDFFDTRDGIEIRSGSVRETGGDCQAAVMSFALAHDRYGGVPVLGSAQVLVNQRGDGAPEHILATPPRRIDTASETPTAAEIELGVLEALTSCVAAYLETGPPSDAKVLIHLEAAGIDRPDLTPTLRAIGSFLDSGPR